MNQQNHLDSYLKSLGGEVFHYGNASHGFLDALLYLKRTAKIENPNVIMPAYIPAKLYRTVLSGGYEPKFYEITDRCEFDADYIEDLVDERTTAILAVHYFGRPANIRPLREIADRRNIALIEDCAHVLRSSLDGKPLGTYGDFAIFSPRKMLQLSDGGLLLVNNSERKDFKPSYKKRVRTAYTTSKFLMTRLKHFYFKMTNGNDLLHIERLPKVGNLDPNRKTVVNVKRISWMADFYQRTSDMERNSNIRKENYTRLLKGLKNSTFLKPLYDGTTESSPAAVYGDFIDWTPFSLPIVVQDGSRNVLQKELLAHGVSCSIGWPESPFDRNLPETRELSSRIIEFPVHPLLVENQMEKIMDGCAAHARNASSHFPGRTPLGQNPPEKSKFSSRIFQRPIVEKQMNKEVDGGAPDDGNASALFSGRTLAAFERVNK